MKTNSSIPSLLCFLDSQVKRLADLGRIRSSETLKSSTRKLRIFLDNADIPFSRFNAELVESFEGWMKNRGLSRNTTSFYLRNLRSAYRRAVECNLTADTHPFRNVYTGVDKTAKRAISKSDIKAIKMCDLRAHPDLQFARDIFLLSFYTRGMPFIDLAYLQKNNIRGDTLVYRRKKTGQLLSIEWVPQMQEIVDRYPSNTRFLLPIITREDGTERRQYQNQLWNFNRRLKRIAGMCGITAHITSYVSRHSWATIARSENIPLPVISQGLGHDNEATTRIYLASIANPAIDKANKLIISCLD